MRGSETARAEKHAAQLRTIQRTLDQIASVVGACKTKVKELEEQVDSLLYEQEGRGHERAATSERERLAEPVCGGNHEIAPPATQLVWKAEGGEPAPRCHECSEQLVRTEHEHGRGAHATPILAGPPCQGRSCIRSRRRHATMRIITEQNRRGTPYCRGCGDTARTVLEEQGTAYETAPAARLPIPRRQGHRDHRPESDETRTETEAS